MAIVINGSGTVTGISVGGLPDGVVDAGTLATDSVDSAELIDGSIDNSHLASGSNIPSYPRSVSDLFSGSDTQDIDTNLSTAGTYMVVAVSFPPSGTPQSEIGYIVSDGSSLTTVSHASQTSTIAWSNPSGTTLRIRDVNNDKEIVTFGWRIK